MSRQAKEAEAFTVICYDMASNRRRRAIVRELEAWGCRAQESVFECWLNASEREMLWQRLCALADADADCLLMNTLSPGDHAEIHSLGPGTPYQSLRHVII